jgi:predicted XRE-type DNA-binding protein
MYNSVLHDLIKRSGLTQKELSNQTGIHTALISLIINGKLQRQKHHVTISKFFHKPINLIFKGGTNVKDSRKRNRSIR